MSVVTNRENYNFYWKLTNSLLILVTNRLDREICIFRLKLSWFMQMSVGGETKEDDENNDNDSATRKVTDRQFLYHILQMVFLEPRILLIVAFCTSPHRHPPYLINMHSSVQMGLFQTLVAPL